MQCPLCGVSIPPETMLCPGCGMDCTVLFTVQSMQLDLQRARDQSASVGAQLAQLQGQLDAFATHVQTALMQTHPGSAARGNASQRGRNNAERPISCSASTSSCSASC